MSAKKNAQENIGSFLNEEMISPPTILETEVSPDILKVIRVNLFIFLFYFLG